MNTVLIRIDKDVFAKIGEKAREYGIPTAQPNVVLRKMFTLDMPIDVLFKPLDYFVSEISFRVLNALHRKGIITVGDLVNTPRVRIVEMQNLGPRSMKLIDEFLAKHHLSFRE
jgi:DNA-directed RNA polymerase alpha subunit